MANIPETLDGSTVVITGASSGFGRGTALELARQDANVVLAARRTNALDELAAEITTEGGNALAITTDVSVEDDITRLRQRTIDHFGRFDVWINNVGVGALGYFWEIPLKTHARLVDVNLTGLIYGSHAAINQFLTQDGGTLINVGSIDSEVPLALQNTYAATKAAVLSLSRTITEELRLTNNEDRIAVATIMPWAVDTPWWNHAANYTGHAPRMAAMDDPELVIDAIVEACVNPKAETPVGVKARASNISHHIFPDLTEALSGSLAKAESEKATTVPNSDGSIFDPMPEGTSIGGNIRERMKAEDG